MEELSRIVTSKVIDEEERRQDTTLRPANLDEFIGQTRLTENLRVFIESARIRNEPLDHVLLAGPPGLGKTTLAHIIAKEMGVNLRITSAPIIEKAGDLASILTALESSDVLFIDEIHRLSPTLEEILYPAMEDRSIDIVIGQGVGAKSVRLTLAPFTLVGATTRTGLLTSALRDRFGIPLRLNYYDNEELKAIVHRSAKIIGTSIEEDAAMEVARRSRKTPRIVNRLLRRVADFAVVNKKTTIDNDFAQYALEQLEIDTLGLDDMDRKILTAIIQKFDGGPVGLKTIAISVGEETDTIEDYYEPFLVQAGLLKRTQRGRTATSGAYRHLGLKALPKNKNDNQETLF